MKHFATIISVFLAVILSATALSDLKTLSKSTLSPKLSTRNYICSGTSSDDFFDYDILS